MKRILSLLISAWVVSTSALAQFSPLLKDGPANAFNHLDVAVTLGSTGVGVELASPIGEFVQLRAGFEYMPKFDYPMTFDIQLGDNPESKYDDQGNRVQTKFDRMASLLEQFTGFKVNDEVDMIGQPTFNNFKLLVDVFPFRYNKHWHFTAGFHVGPSRIGKAFNTTEEMTSLLAVCMYNNMYQKVKNGEPMFEYPNPDYPEYNEQIWLPYYMEERISAAGPMGIHIGDYAHDVTDEEGKIIHSKGESYMMVPNEEGMCKAEMKVNSFKPYLGFGYGGNLVKGDDRYKISFDCGALFWGGTPSITTHDGTDLTKDVENIRGKVGEYVDLAKEFKVFPVLNLRLSCRLF